MRKRKLGLERPALAGLGLAALMATCAALAAGWCIADAPSAGSGQVMSAGVHAAHLPTPAASYATPGAVVQWRWQPPAAAPEAGASVQAEALPTPTVSGVADPWQSLASVPGSEATTQTAQEGQAAEPSGVPQAERNEVPAGAPEIRRPVAGRISQAYGCSPYYSGIPGPGCPVEAFWFHDGVDIAVGVGTPVQAGMAGRVTFAAADGDGPLCNQGYRGYGLAVMVDNGEGWQALYAHLSGIDVQEGQAVEPETVIGLSGDTGCVSGAHLHFGLRHDGELVDPLEVMQ
jgi:murein DD-endopeptidase MepM/ murein hydrolase activator NlpD